MRFSEHGPDIPDELIDAALHGEVVFLVGAGASQPELPNFKRLVELIYVRLAVEMTAAERAAFCQQRYEETLGALSRRLADNRSLYEAVARELDADRVQDLSHHATILRLSRDFEGKPAVVTTNFDTLLERALHQKTNEDIQDKSFAGALIPAPGGPRFEGVIHLHGRLADNRHHLQRSDLVLTSADYGDAYLRSGWAARFLYDLARTRRIVLVGYSASDAPVRYILNILESDRERFPDLKDIFVLAESAGAPREAAAATWEAIAVRPIIFDALNNDFGPFWQDMTAWADLVELPSQWRRVRLQVISERDPDELADWERDQVRWILKYPDALDLVTEFQLSPAWVAFIRNEQLFRADRHSEWTLGRWASTRLHLPAVFAELLSAASNLGETAADVLEGELDRRDRPPIPDVMQTAWRLLVHQIRQPRRAALWAYAAASRRLRENVASDLDLLFLVDAFTPRLNLRLPFQRLTHGVAPTQLSDLCRVELRTPDYPTVDEFIQHMPERLECAGHFLNLATASLLRALSVARHAGDAARPLDGVSLDVPSIATHPQNEHHHGFLPLVRMCAELWRKLYELDHERARAVGTAWRHSGFSLTTRLWLHTLLHDARLETVDVTNHVLGLPVADFWAHKKEMLDLLRERARGLVSLNQLAERIVEGPAIGAAHEADVRERLRDSARWPYLAALRMGVNDLPTAAKWTFDEISERRGWENRQLEDSDYFWIYSYGARFGPIGDPTPLAEAPAERRIELARQLETQNAFEQADAWRVYCRQDPSGALDALIHANNVGAHANRWRELFYALVRHDDAPADELERRRNYCGRALNHIQNENRETLADLIDPLVDLYGYAVRINAGVSDGMWDVLWACSLAQPIPAEAPAPNREPGHDLVFNAINSPAGKLAQIMINRFGPPWNGLPADAQRTTEARIGTMINAVEPAAGYARAVLIEYVAWLNSSLPDLVGRLLPVLNANTEESAALRSILISRSQHINSALRTRFKQPILTAIPEHRGENTSAENAVSRLIFYMRDDQGKEPDDASRLVRGEARAVLSRSSPEMIAAAAEILADAVVAEADTPPHELWRNGLAAIFTELWPAERSRKTAKASLSLAKLALQAGQAFPEALDAVAPYIVPLDDDWLHLYAVTREELHPTIRQFPRQTLKLLWLLLKPANRGQSHELGQVLTIISEVDPNLVRDRRYQLIATRAMRA